MITQPIKVEIIRVAFNRKIWCSRCWDMTVHSIFYMSHKEVSLEYALVTFHQKCSICGDKGLSKIAHTDWNHLVKNDYR